MSATHLLQCAIVALVIRTMCLSYVDCSRRKERRYGCREKTVILKSEYLKMKTEISVIPTRTRDISTCDITVKAPPEYLIRASIDFSPKDEERNCENEFLYAGNDIIRKNKDYVTSYSFCNVSVKQEIVSRGNTLWFIYGPRNQVTSETLQIKIDFLAPVHCNKTEFACSPVQCVQWSRVCDGVSDCINGRDEYCGLIAEDTHVDSEPHYARSTAITEPCFRCTNGKCIRPELPRYSEDWGRPLWYLCDGVNHCMDGTDERPDVCMLLHGRGENVLTCNHISSPGVKQLIWRKDIECNQVQECQDNEDETDCVEHELRPGISSLPSVFIVGAAVSLVTIIFGFLIHRMRKKETTKLKKNDEEDALTNVSARPRMKRIFLDNTNDSTALEQARSLRFSQDSTAVQYDYETDTSYTSQSTNSSPRTPNSGGSAGYYSWETGRSDSPYYWSGASNNEPSSPTSESGRRTRVSRVSATSISLQPVTEDEEVDTFLPRTS